MSKHTPGPWTYIAKEGVLRGPAGRFIAQLEQPLTADLTLIVAAPDMAEALRNLLGAFRECIGSAAFFDFEQSNPAVRAAQRALAKAGF